VAAFPSFTRVSIDQIIYSRHGIYGADYPPDRYDEYQTEADGIYDAHFRQLLREGRDIVLDRSFYAKEDRDEFRDLVEQAGARRVLVYFKADRDVLWKRICERRARGVNADSALEISEELLDAYFAGFEAPVGEGEMVIHVA
jgi:predicted kinase